MVGILGIEINGGGTIADDKGTVGQSQSFGFGGKLQRE